MNIYNPLPSDGSTKFFGLDIQIIILLITGAGTLFLFLVTKFYESRHAIKKELKDAKKPTYQKLINTIIRIQVSEKLVNPIPSDKRTEEIIDLFRDMIIWGSDSILKKFIAFVKLTMSADESDEATIKMIICLDEILREIRNEMGHSNKNIKEKEILSVFIRDLDKYKN